MKKSPLLYRIASAVLAILVWQALSVAVNLDWLLVSPLRVAIRLCEMLREGAFYLTLGYSALRIFVGFSVALLLGCVLGVLASRFSVVEMLLYPYVTVMKSVPVASFIILLLLWISYRQLTVVTAFLVAFPPIYSNVLVGMHDEDKKLSEMATLYRIPSYRRFVFISLPGLKPHLMSACAVAVGMAWKSGVAAEVIGAVKGSIGERLYDAKIYLEMCDLLAWTVVIVLSSILTERILLFLMKRAFALLNRM